MVLYLIVFIGIIVVQTKFVPPLFIVTKPGAKQCESSE